MNESVMELIKVVVLFEGIKKKRANSGFGVVNELA
jgi:hypothetical protein